VITWTPEQQALRDALASRRDAFSAGHIDDDAQATFPWRKWEIVGDSGLLSLPFDERWGGLGQSLLTTMYVLEGLGESCRDSGLVFSATTTMASTGVPLERFGSEQLKERYLPGVCAGKVIGAHAITEPRGGSDALNMDTRADVDGDDFVLHGCKTFVSNAPIADVFIIYAKTHPTGGPLGITAFLVEHDRPGLAVGPPVAKMGLRTSPLAELFLDECRIPKHNIVGRVGGGYRILDYVMKREILFSFVVNVGEMQHRLERCVEYARTRTQFGQRIGSYQAVANKLVDMKIRVDTARKWLYDTAERLEEGADIGIDLAISKILTSEANVATGLDAMQVFGGYGYMTEYGIEKGLRDAVASTIYSGTTEIQYNRIASMMGL
jgi:alkylation response protein AidB-like acyl-CoA dehydrogenase